MVIGLSEYEKLRAIKNDLRECEPLVGTLEGQLWLANLIDDLEEWVEGDERREVFKRL